MDLEKDALEYILEQLKVKASIKQLVYRNLQEVFGQLREEGRRITEDLENRIQDIDTLHQKRESNLLCHCSALPKMPGLPKFR